MENEATVFGAQSCPSRKRWRRDVVVSRSSFPLVFFVFFFQTTVVSVSSSVPLCASSSFPPLLLLERAAREREKRARAKKSMHVNLEQKRRDVSACFRSSSVDDFFLLLLSLLRCVSFKRTKDQPTNTKEEALKVFCKYIYIYITRGNESRCCVLRARVSLYSSS